MEPIRATLCGSTKCSAEGITVTGTVPVLQLCRKLVAAGYDPNRPMEVYRGDVLALRVSSIGQAAKLGVRDTVSGRPIFYLLDAEHLLSLRSKLAA